MSDSEQITPSDILRILDPELQEPEAYAAKQWGDALARSITKLAAAFDTIQATPDSTPLVVTGDPATWADGTLTKAVIDGWKKMGYNVILHPTSPEAGVNLMQLPESERDAAWAAERERNTGVLGSAGGLMRVSTPRLGNQPSLNLDPKIVAAYSEQVLSPMRANPASQSGHYTIMPGLSRYDSEALDLPWNVYVFPILLSLLLVDWPSIEANMDRLSKVLDNALEVNIAGPTHHLTFSLDGYRLFPSTTRNNLIGAELFTAPVIDSVDGEFILKGIRHVGPGGLRVRDLHVQLKRGVIVDAKAEEGAEEFRLLFAEAFERPVIGEIGLGGFFNPALWPYTILEGKAWNNFMRYVLLSEKIGDHIAFGSAYPDRKMGDTVYHMNNGAAFTTPGGIRGHYDLVMGRRQFMNAITSYGEQITLMHEGEWVPAFDHLDEGHFWEKFTPMQRAQVAKAFRWADVR